jgi:hypothetical protein
VFGVCSVSWVATGLLRAVLERLRNGYFCVLLYSILRELNVSKLRCKVMRFDCVLLCWRWRCLNEDMAVKCQMGVMIVRHPGGRRAAGRVLVIFTFAMDATALQLQCWSS